MDNYIDVPHDESDLKILAKVEGDICIQKLVDLSKKKRYLVCNNEIPLNLFNYSTIVSMSQKIHKKNVCLVMRDMISAFHFESGDVPEYITIRSGQKMEMNIKTFGQRTVILDIPLFTSCTDFGGFKTSTQCKCFYDILDYANRRYLRSISIVCFYDGTIIDYSENFVNIKHFMRPLRNIVQDAVREAGIYVSNPLLMRRSNRDAKALAARVTDSECIVFEP